MGGNAFKDIDCVRLSRKEFEKFEENVISNLISKYQNIGLFAPIISYDSKESFGDLDILYCEDLVPISPLPTHEQIMETIGATAMIKNGPVTSYAVPIQNGHFQVDLIKVEPNEFDSAFCYFAYNDLGNILGRIYRRAGFKLGHRGLSYIIRDEENSSHVIKELVLSSNWQEILEFIGYDYQQWMNGFTTLNDIFKYATNHPFASRAIFRLDEMNHAARIRDRKRKTYQQFLKWVNDPINNIQENEVISKKNLRIKFLNKAFQVFPFFQEEYNDAQILMQRKRLNREKFNGNIVKKFTGLEGKKMGVFISDFVENFIKGICNQIKEEWIEKRSPQEIEKAIKYWFSQWVYIP